MKLIAVYLSDAVQRVRIFVIFTYDHQVSSALASEFVTLVYYLNCSSTCSVMLKYVNDC